MPAALVVLAACGCTPTGPTPIVSPTPTAQPGGPVSGVVFYDENSNGNLDSTEVVRIPGVTISIGGRTGNAEGGGRFVVPDAPLGPQKLTVRPETLPPYFLAGAPLEVQVPSVEDVLVPLTLPIGERYRPNLYLGYGNSITFDGGSLSDGYLTVLTAEVRNRWGKAEYAMNAESGARSIQGANLLPGVLQNTRPAYTLILYGTNDWTRAECKDAGPGCFTVESLRNMVQTARQYGSLPILATIPPVNPDYVDLDAEARNAWVKQINVGIRAMATQERVPLADVWAAFPQGSVLPPLFFDDIHPNGPGHHIIGETFFQTITQPGASTATARRIAGDPRAF